MAPTKKPVVEFDPAKLEKIHEPITVTVTRMANGQREPVVLPNKPEESVPGRGWSKDDVMQMDNFIATKWSGAGSYEMVAAGANGETMKWKSYFPESKYPLLHQGEPIARPASQAGVIQSGLGQPAVAPGGGGWLGGLPAPQQPGVAFPPPVPAQPWPSPSPWNGANGNWMASAAPPPWQRQQPFGQPPAQNLADPGVQKEREERLKLEAKIDRERLENAYEKRLGALGGQLDELKRQLTQPTGESEEVKLLREQLRRMESQASDDKLVRLIEESNRTSREMIQAVQAQTRDQLTQMQQAIAAKPQGPDQGVLLLIETMKANSDAQKEVARAQADAQKEAARIQAEAQKEASRNAIGPREMIDLMRSSSIGQEQLASAYGKVWELMQQGMETVLATQGPAPHPALELVGQAAQGGLEVAQRYVQMKERSAMANAQAQAATAQAQAVAAQAQEPAAQEVRTGPGQTIETPALMGAQDEEEPEDVRDAEEELFGQGLPQVLELRAAVAGDAVNPKQCAAVIIGGIEQMANAGLSLPVMDLWAQGQLVELVSVVIPDAKTSFQEHTIEALFAQRQQLMEQHGVSQS